MAVVPKRSRSMSDWKAAFASRLLSSVYRRCAFSYFLRIIACWPDVVDLSLLSTLTDLVSSVVIGRHLLLVLKHLSVELVCEEINGSVHAVTFGVGM